jgi:hypothetical protein
LLPRPFLDPVPPTIQPHLGHLGLSCLVNWKKHHQGWLCPSVDTVKGKV